MFQTTLTIVLLGIAGLLWVLNMIVPFSMLSEKWRAEHRSTSGFYFADLFFAFGASVVSQAGGLTGPLSASNIRWVGFPLIVGGWIVAGATATLLLKILYPNYRPQDRSHS